MVVACSYNNYYADCKNWFYISLKPTNNWKIAVLSFTGAIVTRFLERFYKIYIKIRVI